MKHDATVRSVIGYRCVGEGKDWDDRKDADQKLGGDCEYPKHNLSDPPCTQDGRVQINGRRDRDKNYRDHREGGKYSE
jgi:hypothetical protein